MNFAALLIKLLMRLPGLYLQLRRQYRQFQKTFAGEAAQYGIPFSEAERMVSDMSPKALLEQLKGRGEAPEKEEERS